MGLLVVRSTGLRLSSLSGDEADLGGGVEGSTVAAVKAKCVGGQ